LLEDLDPGKDVEVIEFGWFLFYVTKRVAQGCFCKILSSCIFGEDFGSG